MYLQCISPREEGREGGREGWEAGKVEGKLVGYDVASVLCYVVWCCGVNSAKYCVV